MLCYFQREKRYRIQKLMKFIQVYVCVRNVWTYITFDIKHPWYITIYQSFYYFLVIFFFLLKVFKTFYCWISHFRDLLEIQVHQNINIFSLCQHKWLVIRMWYRSLYYFWNNQYINKNCYQFIKIFMILFSLEGKQNSIKARWNC